ncbi:Outer membrane protein B precursor [Poriferisphaera corsica]|uniref:Outer membrane protein B n=1 Tax=Poriferisphaera corsica TaxID=2528020 RepID=A0A517YQ38_9BACT|nr:autotransporter domain-containing protein [Poriferisphaera corsica]QDU32338.1 Outer membrane protein B precursor [Poriferisphaera corsica]
MTFKNKAGRRITITTSALLTAWMCMSSSSICAAKNITWDGGGSGDGWSTKENWDHADGVSNDDTVTFDTASAATSVVDITETITSLNYSNGGANSIAINISGSNALTLRNITNNSSVEQTITASSQSGTLIANNSFGLTIDAANGLKYTTGTLNLVNKTLTLANGTTFTLDDVTIQNLQDLSIGDGAKLVLKDTAGSAGNITFNGASGDLEVEGDTLAIGSTRSVTLATTTNIKSSNEGEINIAGKITGTGDLNIDSDDGNGSITISNTGNDFEGDVTLKNGRLILTADDVLGDKDNDTGNKLVIEGGEIAVKNTSTDGITINNAVELNGDFKAVSTYDSTATNDNQKGPQKLIIAGKVTLGADSAIDVELEKVDGSEDAPAGTQAEFVITGVIGETGGARKITKNGDGKLVLEGDNTFTGGVDLAAGTLALSHDNALGSGNLTITGTSANVVLKDGVTIGNTLDISADDTLNVEADSAAGEATLTSNIAIDDDTTIDVNTGTINMTGNITDTGTNKLTKDGDGTLVLAGDVQHTGGTTIANGKLVIQDDNVAATGKDLGVTEVAAGATLDAQEDLSVSNLTGEGNITLTKFDKDDDNTTDDEAANITITTNSDSEFAGNISGEGQVTLDGTSKITLSGASTYSGGTVIEANANVVAKNNKAFGSGDVAFKIDSATLNVADGITIGNTLDLIGNNNIKLDSDGMGTLSSDITLDDDKIFDIISNSIELSGVISGTRKIEKNGAGDLILSGVNTFANGVDLNAGKLTIGNDDALGAGTLKVADGTTLASKGNNAIANDVNFDDGAGASATSVTFDGDGKLTLGKANDDDTAQLGTVTFDDDGTTINNNSTDGELILNGTTAGGALTLDGSGTTRFTDKLTAGHASTTANNGYIIDDTVGGLTGFTNAGAKVLKTTATVTDPSVTINLSENDGLATSLQSGVNNTIANNVVIDDQTVLGGDGLILTGAVELQDGIDDDDKVALEIANGGNVTLTGDITLTGADTIEKLAAGTLNLNNADNQITANLEAKDGTTNIGGAGLTGNVTVDGANAIVKNTSTITGNVNVNNGAFTAAANVTENVTVEANGTLNIATTDILATDKTLTLKDGATIAADGTSRTVNANVAYDNNGTVNVTGPNSLTLANNVDLDGNATTQTFNISKDASLVLSGKYTDATGDNDKFTLNKTGQGAIIVGNQDSAPDANDATAFFGDINTNAGTTSIIGAGVDGDVTVSTDTAIEANTILKAAGKITGTTTIESSQMSTSSDPQKIYSVLEVASDDAFDTTSVLALENEATIAATGADREVAANLNLTTGNTVRVIGTHKLSLSDNIDVNGATLAQTFEVSENATLALTGDITDSNDASDEFFNLTKTGKGAVEIGNQASLDLFNDDTDDNEKVFAGNLTVTDGTITLMGSKITGDVEVNYDESASTQGIFAGTGIIAGNLNINDGAIHNPGQSPGKLNVEGTYTVGEDATVNFEIDTVADAHDQINVTGNVTIDDKAVANVNFSGDKLEDGKTYDLIVTEGSFTGNQSFRNTDDTLNINDNRLFFDTTAELDSTGKKWQAKVTENGIKYDDVSDGKTNTQIAKTMRAWKQEIVETPAAGSIDEDRKNVLDALNSASNRTEFNGMVSQLNAPQHVAAAPEVFNNVSAGNNQVTGRLAGLRGGTEMFGQVGASDRSMTNYASDPTVLALALDTPQEMLDWFNSKDYSAWGKIFGQYSDQDTTKDRLGYTALSAGVVGGVDCKVNDQFILGVLGSFTQTEIDFDDSDSENSVNTIRSGVYASYYVNDAMYVDGVATLGYNWTESERQIKVGSIDRTADADYESVDLSLYGGTGFDWVMGSFTVTPNAWAQYTFFSQDEFSETGAGSLNTTVEEYDTYSFRTQLGVKITRMSEINGRPFMPEFSIGWIHEFAELDEMEARFTGETNPFSYDPGTANEDALFIGGGVTTLLSDRSSLFVKYDGEFAKDGMTQALSAGLKFKF